MDAQTRQALCNKMVLIAAGYFPHYGFGVTHPVHLTSTLDLKSTSPGVLTAPLQNKTYPPVLYRYYILAGTGVDLGSVV